MRKGFSLVEILVVVGISALLLGIVVSGQREFSRRRTVDNAAVSLMSDLRQAQTQSTSGVKPKSSKCNDPKRLNGYTATFTDTGYIINADCTGGTVTIKTVVYPDSVTSGAYPSLPLTFKSVGQGTDITGSESVVLCAFGYGKEVVVTSQGDISSKDVDCSATPTILPGPSTTTLPTGDGLYGEYYESNFFADLPGGFTRVDPQIDFNWNGAEVRHEGAGVGSDEYSIRWKGKLLAPENGDYKFRIGSDDGSRLIISGVKVADIWYNHAYLTSESAVIPLVGGQYYDIIMEYYQDGGVSRVNLSWQTPSSGSFVTIPQANLFSN